MNTVSLKNRIYVMLNHWLVGLCVGVFGLGLVGCGGDENVEGGGAELKEGQYRIVATTGMVGDIVKVVVGDTASVVNLMGPGVDPHLYSATTADAKLLAKADVIIYTGLYLEGRIIDIFKNMQKQGKTTLAIAECLDKRYLRTPEGFDGHPDPHVWMDIKAWGLCVKFVAEELGKYKPELAEEYEANAAAYLKTLDKLDAYAKDVVGRVPENSRVLVTAHDAFGYFARAYGLEVKAIQGVSTDSEAGIKDISRLVDYLVENKISAIFVESSVRKDFVQKVIDNAKIKGHTVKIGGELFSDAMGSEGTYEGTFVGMLDHNATLIARGLGAKGVDEKGMQGKLTIEEAH